MKKFIAAAALFWAAHPAGNAQNTIPNPPAEFPSITASQRQQRERETAGPQARSREQVLQGIARMRTLTAGELNELIAASAPDMKVIPPLRYIHEYYDYAVSETKGLVRIFPDKNCGGGAMVTLAELERCADVPQRDKGGSIYNFRSDGRWGLGRYATILHFTGGNFEMGNDVVQAVLADLGDIDINAVDMKHKAFKFLSDYDPKQKIDAIRKQNEVLKAGIRAEGYTFTNSSPAKTGSVYAMRSVIYRYREPGADMPRRGFDQFIVLKVVGREPDGSMIVIWKALATDFPRRKLNS